ncbi:MAG: nitrite/sulfite reductase [Candidatus Dadabacteria bacterium]|nr:nitrite/sulfite reductase [Candidatus Dadabacteria bacterium]
MDDMREQALKEIEALRESIRQFQNGEITPEQFRPRRLAYGIYAQLPHTSNMLRLKLPAGVVSARQLEAIASVAEKWGRSLAHVTTRQDIQFHWVPLEAAPEIFTQLLEVGMINRGACSDSIRNVTSCPMAGQCRTEFFDVIPYARAISDYFLFHPFNLIIPRKFKISVSGCASDCALGSMHEIGIIATSRGSNGSSDEGFIVKAGGGLGSLPHLARGVRDFIPKQDILIICEAIVRVFHRMGNRKNRLRARMKFLMKKLGYEEFLRVLNEEYELVEAECGDALRSYLTRHVEKYSQPAVSRQPGDTEPNTVPSEDDPEEFPEDFQAWHKTNVTPQKQTGYSSATVKLTLGDASSDQLRSLAQITRELGNGTIRTTVSQNFVIPYIVDSDLTELYSRLKELELAEPNAHHVDDVVSCPGADYCSIAITKSMGVGAKVRAHLQGRQTDVDKLGKFRIQISGCPNSCGQHHIGDIGLTGLMVKGKDGIERPHYSILVGGGITGDNPTIAQRLTGKHPEEATPKIIAAIANNYLENKEGDEAFKDYVARVGLQTFSRIARAISRENVVDAPDPKPGAID